MEDSNIIALYWERDESAIAETALKYGNYCGRIAENILHNKQDAEECVNTAYFKAWERIPPEKPNILSAFLAKLTRNTALDTYRRLHSEKRGSGQVPLIYDELEDCVSGGSSPAEETERREMVAAINKFLSGLPKKNRVIFVSRYCCCESISELAMRFGMSENNLSVNLSRTRKKLREYLEKEGYRL